GRKGQSVARRHLRGNPRDDVAAGHLDGGAHVSISPGEPSWVLSLPPATPNRRRRHDGTLSDSADRSGEQTPLWLLAVKEDLESRGWGVNHKRIGRIMREGGLLCLRKSKFMVTTDSRPSLQVNLNL